jgi:hypothetical protein
MFFTLTSLRALIIDADDFSSRPHVFTEIITALDLVIKVVLVTRRNWVAPHLEERTVRPTDILEHLDFKILLKRTITEIKVPPASTVFLCSSTNTLELAKELLLGTVVFIKQPLTDPEKHLLYQESPDFVVDSLDALFKCLSTIDSGYASEIASAPYLLINSPYNYSSPLITSTNSATLTTPTNVTPPIKSTTRIVKLPNLEHPDCPFYVMGRYFGPSDPRYQLHALSLRIWNFKKHHAPHAAIFADLFRRGIEAATGGAYDLITQVPSRPEVGDRLAHILTLMQSRIPRFNASTERTSGQKTNEILPARILPNQLQPNGPQLQPNRIQPNILRCVKSYPPLKALNLQARKASIAKVFEVQTNVQDKHIVIIDDIVTTGATINACIAELKAAGAASITAVFLAYHPYALKPRPDKSIHSCTECGEKLLLTFEPTSIYFRCFSGNDTDSAHPKIPFNKAVTIPLF